MACESTFTIGFDTTVTVDLAVSLHPVAVIVPVTKYDVVVVGVAVTDALVRLFNVALAVQAYVFAPAAVSVAVDFSHIIGEFTVMIGSGLMVTTAVSLLEHCVVVLVPVTI
jgi:hypothetical protein